MSPPKTNSDDRLPAPTAASPEQSSNVISLTPDVHDTVRGISDMVRELRDNLRDQLPRILRADRSLILCRRSATEAPERALKRSDVPKAHPTGNLIDCEVFGP